GTGTRIREEADREPEAMLEGVQPSCRRLDSPIMPAAGDRASACFHCGLEAPPGGWWRGELLGEEREFCCAGCRAVARAIFGSGLGEYYALRSRTAPHPHPLPRGGGADEEGIFDPEGLQRSVVRGLGGEGGASVLVEGVRFPACLWLNEQRLSALAGVLEAAVSYPDRTARVRWDPARLRVSEILAAVREIGYAARPYDSSHRREVEREAKRRDSARLVFAGAAGMMVMNLALARYFAGGPDASGKLALWEPFARWCELAGSAVLLAYPGQDFFAGAWRDLARRRPGMDVPIALGLAATWIGGAWATLRGSGPVYFDAI